MNTSTVMHQMSGDLGILLAIIFILFVGLRLFGAKFKGKMGELKVDGLLVKLPSTTYHTLDNVLLRKKDGRTSQIDHIVVSKFGVFVIETKNRGGQIVGTEHQNQWTQSMGRQRHTLQNPLHQNFGHVRTLQEVLPELPETAFVPIVVFPNHTSLRVHASSPVLHMRDLVRWILAQKTVRLTDGQVGQAYAKLKEMRVVDKTAYKEHVRRIQKDTRAMEQAIHTGVCPKCGGKLIQRQGRYGSFWGCSGFPHCRFRASIR
ncbi:MULTISPECIES: nuclease-related domain-containing protein [Alicyclobacillus]|uniref:NERD domain-containing protein n=1 Tax=Alicyclobacillus tolerans TaxID=90970 RepID=A0ABT9M0L2_9BACL|nr:MULTISPECIES: NERD domain-containing protein [Alicyclobacillus]MDP9729921.1 hypothetical protein [Alicyclobacillus tengchongensis]